MEKNLPPFAGDTRDMGSVPGSGKSPGGGHGNPLQYSCLENPMDKKNKRSHVNGQNWNNLGIEINIALDYNPK